MHHDKAPNDEIKGHTVTYLDRIFNRYAGSVYTKMMDFCKSVDRKMKWDLLEEDSYQTKCIEYIQYQQKGDNLGWHCDMGSLVTIVIMLSSPSEYEGGSFQCRKLKKGYDGKYIEGQAVDVPLNKGDIVVFASDKCNHRVTDLIKGKRTVLVMELIFW